MHDPYIKERWIGTVWQDAGLIRHQVKRPSTGYGPSLASVIRSWSKQNTAQQDKHYGVRTPPSFYHTPTIPKLTKNNTQTWILAIRCEAIALDGEETLSQHIYVLPADQFCSISVLVSAFLSSIPEELLAAIITPNISFNSQQMVNRVQEKWKTNTAADRQFLELQAENTLLINYNQLDEYFKAHEHIQINE